MSDETKSDKESAEVHGDQHDGVPSVSRRGTIVSLLGIGGLGLVGGTQEASAAPPSKPRPWNQDVNARGNDLFNLGSLATEANTTAITDFAGRGLSIDDRGVLNTTSSGGIRGEQILLQSLSFGGNFGSADAGPDEYDLLETVSYVIRFGDLRGASDLSLSISGVVSLDSSREESERVGLRLFDEARSSPISDTQVEDTIQSGEKIALTGPKATYNSNEANRITIEFRSTYAILETATIEVWGETSNSQPLEVSVHGQRVDITNVGNQTVQVRDLDGKGGDLITGRPRLNPSKVLTKHGIAPGTYYVQAWDGRENTRLAPPIEVVVEDN